MITWITRNIAIGELCDILDNPIEDLKKIGITSVLTILSKDDPRLRKKFREAWHKRVLIRQHFARVGGTNPPDPLELEVAYSKLDSIFFADYQEKVLVHCVAGMDRSPFVVAKYLTKEGSVYDGEEFHSTRTMSEAYSFIKKKRPQIIEHLEWVWWKDGSFDELLRMMFERSGSRRQEVKK